MANVEPFSSGQLEQLARELGETTTGPELDRLLAEARLPSSDFSTKWRRLREAFEAVQRRDQSGNAVARFIELALDPARFATEPERYEAHRERINVVLGFNGLTLREDGRLAPVSRVGTIPEAQKRASGLRAKLRLRGVHADVLSFCQAELVEENYFHAVLEATKSVGDKIRTRTGEDGDGAPLVDSVFGLKLHGMPMLAFNRLETETEKGEHNGLATLIRGMFATFRNPAAHAPKVRWAVNEQDALDLLTIASLLHRRLDDAYLTPRAPSWNQGSDGDSKERRTATSYRQV